MHWTECKDVALRHMAYSSARASDLEPEDRQQMSEDREFLVSHMQEIADSIWGGVVAQLHPLDDDHVLNTLSSESFLSRVKAELPDLHPHSIPTIIKPSTLTRHLKDLEPLRSRLDYLLATLDPVLSAWEDVVAWAENKIAAFSPTPAQHQAKATTAIFTPSEVTLSLITLREVVSSLKHIQEAQRRNYELCSRLHTMQTSIPTGGGSHEGVEKAQDSEPESTNSTSTVRDRLRRMRQN